MVNDARVRRIEKVVDRTKNPRACVVVMEDRADGRRQAERIESQYGQIPIICLPRKRLAAG